MCAWSAGALPLIAAPLLSPIRPVGAADQVFNTQDFSPFNYEVNAGTSGTT